MKKILSLIAIMLGALLGYSQAPGILNYQGVARNSVGNVLVNKTINLRLTIRDGAAAGPTVYQESRVVTTNPFGLFNVQVGSPGATSVTGTIPGVNWAVGAKFIQVEIDPNGGTSFINIGTAQLASVPYSLYSNLSGDLVLPFNKTQADPGTLFKITNSNTTSAGATALEGLTNSTAGNASAIIGTVTSAAPGAFSAGVRGINNGTGGNGIGVYGSQNGSGWGVYGNAPSGIGVNGTSTSGTGVFGTSSTGSAGVFSNTNTANNLPTVAISTSSTNAPALRVTGPDIWGSAIAINNSVSGMEWRMNVQASRFQITKVPGTTFTPFQLFDDGQVEFPNTSGGQRVRILNNGDVGIGTAGPFARLTVVQNNSGVNVGGGANTGSEVKFLGFGTSHISIYNRGNSALTFANTSALAQTDVLGAPLMTLTTAGRLGIGTTTPARNLHVVGNVNITDGTQALNRILTSDATGNASWQDPSGIGVVTGSGTLNFIPKWTPNGTNLGNSLMRDDNNSVSVGNFFADPNSFNVYTTPGSSTNASLFIGLNSASGLYMEEATGDLHVTLNGVNVQAGQKVMTFEDGSLNVGIGTTAPSAKLHALSVAATGGPDAVLGQSNNTDASAVGIRGVITSTTPGGFSAGVRGINNGTGGLGIGVYGSQAGSGWGVYGTTPNGIGVHGSSTTGFGMYGLSTNGTGVYGISANGESGRFENTNNTNASHTLNAITNGTGRALNVIAGSSSQNATRSLLGTAPATSVATAGSVYGESGSGIGVVGVSGTQNGVYGLSAGGLGGTTGVNTGSGNGLWGVNIGSGRAGYFQVINAANSNNAVEIDMAGLGRGIDLELSNVANVTTGINVSVAGSASGIYAETQSGFAGVEGRTNTISGAGIIGRNMSNGEAIVGFTTANGAAAGAVVGRNDGDYAGVHGFSTHANGIGIVARVINATATNSVALLANNAQGGASGNIAIFQNNGTNEARIDRTGRGYFNNGTQVGGADVAEFFEVEGDRNEYEAGDVLVISQNSDRKVEKSSTAYSTLVSGVYATKPGILLTERNAEANETTDMVPMGVIGVIPTKVCLEGGEIRRGDLLVTSSIPGVAMKADPEKVKVGQVLGKALQDFNSNAVGKINVLVSVK